MQFLAWGRPDEVNELLARHSHLSKFHMHRLLRHTLGMPVMNYVRARKITDSLEPLFSKRYTVLEVGVMYDFEHERRIYAHLKNILD